MAEFYMGLGGGGEGGFEYLCDMHHANMSAKHFYISIFLIAFLSFGNKQSCGEEEYRPSCSRKQKQNTAFKSFFSLCYLFYLVLIA